MATNAPPKHPEGYSSSANDQQAGENGKAKEAGEAGESGKDRETGETGKSGEGGETGGSGEGGETGGSGEAGETGKSGEGGETGGSGEAGETGKSGEGGEAGETDEGGGERMEVEEQGQKEPQPAENLGVSEGKETDMLTGEAEDKELGQTKGGASNCGDKNSKTLALNEP